MLEIIWGILAREVGFNELQLHKKLKEVILNMSFCANLRVEQT